MTFAGPEWSGGYVAAAPTPFTRLGDLDESRLRVVVRHYIREGAAGISVNGTAGEWFLQEADERRRVAEIAREIVPKEVPFIVGLSAQSLRETLALAEHAQVLGAAAGLVGLPLGRAWSDDEVVGYYRTISESTDLPVIIYSLRQAHGAFFSLELIHRLASVERVIGVKDDAPDLERRRELISGDHNLAVFADVLHPAILGQLKDVQYSQIGAGMPLGSPLADALREPFTDRSMRAAKALAYIKEQLVGMYGASQPWHRDLKSLLFAEGIDAGYPRFPGRSGREDSAVIARYREILERAKELL